jgi:hypothetical protein
MSSAIATRLTLNHLRFRRPAWLARREPGQQARTRREAPLDTAEGRDPRRRRTCPLPRPRRAAPGALRGPRLHRPAYRRSARPRLGRNPFDAELIRVHRQLSSKREHAPLKTEAGGREVVLAPAVAKLLRERWLASSFKAPYHLAFCNTLGRALDYAASARLPARQSSQAQRHHRHRTALAALARPRLRLAADLEGPERRLRVPPAQARQLDRHTRHLRAPIRARRPRPRRQRGARGELRGDGQRGRLKRHGSGNSGGNRPTPEQTGGSLRSPLLRALSV